ncbi:MAG TPA: hypothetical protein VKX39_04600 [Bryobacteraceae bacterium]|jgi:hypothetical protein|nr:hypothetical protein [Bryobacteraceae bacterium]
MKTLRYAVFAMLAGSAFADTVSQNLLNLVMPDTVILSGAQVDQMTASPFGQYLLSQFQPNNPGFMQFVGATGFDPRYDLQYLLAATSVQAGNNQVLILGVGNFQQTKITTAATAQGATISTYKGVTILTGKNNNLNGSPGALAFLDNQTIAMGALPVVQGAIDRLKSGARFSGALASQAQFASGTYQAWFATVTPLSDFLNGKMGGNFGNLSQNNLFQSIQQSSGGANFAPSGVTVAADLVTASPQNAQAVVDVLQFLVSMIQGNANQPKLGALANATSFTVNGSTAHVMLGLSEQQAEQLVAHPASTGARRRREPAQR